MPRDAELPGWAGVLLAAALLVAAGAAGAAPALAQATGDGFLFRTPRASLAVRVGYDRALVGGDLFSFLDSLTLRRSDFGAFTVAADLAGTIGPQLDVVIGVAWSGSRTGSEYRHFWDQDSLPIAQTTSLQRVPITASLKFYPRPRGRAVGNFAWVPAPVAPYVGAGVGALWSEFRQVGDFVDFTSASLPVFTDNYISKSWTFTAHAFAGLEINVGPRTFVTTEARYTWAKPALGGDFEGYGRMNLSGLQVTAGFGMRM